MTKNDRTVRTESMAARVPRRDPRADPDDSPAHGRVDIVTVERGQRARVEQATSRIQELEATLKVRDADVAELRRLNETAMSELDETRARLAAAHANLERLELDLEASRGARSVVEARAEAAEESLAALQESTDLLRVDLEKALERWRSTARITATPPPSDSADDEDPVVAPT